MSTDNFHANKDTPAASISEHAKQIANSPDHLDREKKAWGMSACFKKDQIVQHLENKEKTLHYCEAVTDYYSKNPSEPAPHNINTILSQLQQLCNSNPAFAQMAGETITNTVASIANKSTPSQQESAFKNWQYARLGMNAPVQTGTPKSQPQTQPDPEELADQQAVRWIQWKLGVIGRGLAGKK